MENDRRQQLAWLDFVLRTKGWRTAELARRSGVNASTFAKFKNDPENKSRLEPGTITLIERATGLKAFDTTQTERPRGLGEQESIPYDAEPVEVLNEAVRALRSGRNGVDPWVLRSRCLEVAGYVPGDVLMVDMNAKPEQGDVVCAQVYDRLGRAETVFRIFEDPFLVASSLDGTFFKPLLIDNERVVVRGVVVASFRDRRAA